MSYIITKKNHVDGSLEMLKETNDYWWSEFAQNHVKDLDWFSSNVTFQEKDGKRVYGGINLPRQFPKKTEADWYLLRYLTTMIDRGRTNELEFWHFETKDYGA